jgi:hypothetical protein
LNARYAEAYDEAQILETNKARFDREYQSKANYFQSQYAKSREGENQKVLDQIFKPFGLETKAVLEKVPEQYRNNPFAVMDYALKQIASTKDTEIASLKEQLKTADEKANEKYRAKWDNSNPASVPHKSSGGGNSGEVKFSKDVTFGLLVRAISKRESRPVAELKNLILFHNSCPKPILACQDYTNTLRGFV